LGKIMKHRLELKLRWDLDRVPAGRASTRGLLVDVTVSPASSTATSPTERLPVNLALVLDRSGSMRGARLEAVVEGTLGLIDSLTYRDTLSLIAFDHDVQVLATGQPMNEANCRAIANAVRELSSGGTTDLSRGWYEGARYTAMALESTGGRGHLVVLSDGKANQGITDPGELGRHAGSLANRGVTSSAVGVGPDYSPLQLDAIAEHGGGRLHHCDFGSDIVDVILGELGEARDIAASDAELRILSPQGVTLEVLNYFPVDSDGRDVRIKLGALSANRTRSNTLLAQVAAHEVGEPLPFDVQLTCRSTDDPERTQIDGATNLHVVPLDAVRATERVGEVAERIADLWEATLVYRGTRLNELGDFGQAVELLDVAERRLAFFTDDLGSAATRASNRRDLRRRLSRAWHGAAKLGTLDMSKKMMRSEADPRRIKRGDWRDEMRK
jgi:Ca-activated chloride channel family protein